MGLNDEVDEEFGRPSDEPVTIAQPENGAESDNDVRDEDIFTKGIKPRRIPQLEAEFVIQKSREDRLVQLGEKTHEISTAGGISRNDIIAIESIVEEPRLESEQESQPEQTTEEDTEEEVSEDKPVEAESPLGVNKRLYTEERSKTEYGPTVTLLKSKYEKACSDLKVSTLELADKLISFAKDEIQEKKISYSEISAKFNKSIVGFLTDFESTDLEDVKCSFTRSIKWSDLMTLDLHYLSQTALIGSDQLLKDKFKEELRDTKCAEFIESLESLFRSRTIFKKICNHLTENSNVVFEDGVRYNIDNHTYEMIPVKRDEESIFIETPTIGSIFKFIGTNKSNDIIKSRLLAYDYCVQDTRRVKEEIINFETNNSDENNKEKLDTLLELSGSINENKNRMCILLNDIGAIFEVYRVIDVYLNKMTNQ